LLLLLSQTSRLSLFPRVHGACTTQLGQDVEACSHYCLCADDTLTVHTDTDRLGSLDEGSSLSARFGGWRDAAVLSRQLIPVGH
jgi:hypothetical protein